MSKKLKQPTNTSVILAALRQRDDFMSKAQIKEQTQFNDNQVSATLHHLWTRCKVIDCIITDDGTSWWYALPEENDQRLWTHDERCPETKPRNRKASPKRRITD